MYIDLYMHACIYIHMHITEVPMVYGGPFVSKFKCYTFSFRFQYIHSRCIAQYSFKMCNFHSRFFCIQDAFSIHSIQDVQKLCNHGEPFVSKFKRYIFIQITIHSFNFRLGMYDAPNFPKTTTCDTLLH